jgi:hypothetical protein
LKRPDPSEYAPYYGRYIEKVPDGPIVDLLRTQVRGTLDLLRALPEAKGDHSYAPGKWSIKQVVGHVIDGERVFAYRALRFGRSDATQLPGFEQDDYARAGGFAARTLRHLTDELEAVRRSTVLLYEGFGEEDWSRKGIASENPVTVRALAYIIAGHELHHAKMLKEKYLA